MIAITGANGKLGRHVIQKLLTKVKPSELVVTVRDPEKAKDFKSLGITIRVADYNNPETLNTAFQGVTKLLLISSSEVGARLTQHKAVIEAAQKQNVKHIFYTSILCADTSTLALAEEHLATEKEILKSGLKYTFLRNGWYLENHTENLTPALQHLAILAASGDGRFSSASRADYAEAAVATLTQAGHENKIYELAGDLSFTVNDLAKEVSAQTGKSIVFNNLPANEYEKLLISFGLPEGFARILVDSDLKAQQGQLESASKDLSRLIGKETTSLKQAVQSALK